MGWSCLHVVGETIERMQDACVQSTGSSNVVKLPNGVSYFWELSSREYPDGHATGGCFRMVTEHQAIPCGRFSIDRRGKVKGPAWLRALAASGRTLPEQWASER